MWQIIHQAMEKKQWSRYRLAKEAGISEGVLVKLKNGESKNPGIILLFKISDALNIDINVFRQCFEELKE